MCRDLQKKPRLRQVIGGIVISNVSNSVRLKDAGSNACTCRLNLPDQNDGVACGKFAVLFVPLLAAKPLVKIGCVYTRLCRA